MEDDQAKNNQHCEAQQQIESLKSAIRHNEQAIDDMRSMVTALESCLRTESRDKNNIIQLGSSPKREAESHSQSA